MLPPRHLWVLRGPPAATAAAAVARAAGLAPAERRWIGPDGPPDAVPLAAVRSLLGESAAAVVLAVGSDPASADALAVAEGLVRAGGCLVLRVGDGPLPGRFGARLERALRAAAPLAPPLGPLGPGRRPSGPPPGQDALVAELQRAWAAGAAAPAQVLVADRGRGKSAALGRALRGWGPGAAIVAPHPAAAATALAFAGTSPPPVRTPAEALRRPAPAVLVIEEAAQLPLAMLERVCAHAAGSALALATTCHGYEGSGRGFVQRFLPALQATPRGAVVHTLRDPVRWAPDDPLEAWVRDLLLLDAELPPAPPAGPLRVGPLDRDALADDDAALRGVWALLVGAHHRTTPADLVHLLDGPTLAVYAASAGGSPAAVNLVSREGGLSEVACAAAARAGRLPHQALADTLLSHATAADLLAWPLLRSVRIVTHPACRRAGIAAGLVRAVEAAEPARLVGTIFGASPAVLAFRRALGYRLVRVGISRGPATGEPAAVMLRPADPAAAARVDALQRDLARNLDAILALLEADHGLPFSPEERAAFWEGLPAPAHDPAAVDAAVARYLAGAAPADAWAGDLARWAHDRADALAAAAPPLPALVAGRLWEQQPWPDVAAAAGLTVPAAMRALRRGLRALAGLDGTRPVAE